MDNITAKTDEQLLNQTGYEYTTEYQQLAVAELQRRYIKTVREQVHALTEATNQVHREVALLADSSGKMERLTVTIKTLTICLIVFAIVQIIIAALQTWKMFQSVR